MSIAHLVRVGVICAIVFGGATAFADAAIAVLDIEAEGAEAVGKQITETLRQRVSSTPGQRLLPGKDFIEIKLVFGCDGESPSCLAQAGRSLGADKLVFGILKRSGPARLGAWALNLKVLDVKTQLFESQLNQTFSKREFSAAAVSNISGRWFGSLFEGNARPAMTVTSNPSGAAVVIDGQLVGRTPLIVREYAAGAHTVAVSIAGHQTAIRTVDLRAGSTQEVNVKLETEAAGLEDEGGSRLPLVPSGAVQQSAAVGHPGRPAKIAAIALLGGAVVAGAVAIYTWRTYVNLQDTARSDLLQLRPPNPTEEESRFFSSPTCTPPSTLQMGATFQHFTDSCRSGGRYATATTALWVVAGGLAAGSLTAFLIGDHQARVGKAQGRTKTSSQFDAWRKKISWQTSISPQGGMTTATLSF